MVRVKVCGITSVVAARQASDAGVDAIGLVFYEPSSRNLPDMSVARDIAMAVGPFVTTVGLFVNADRTFIDDILRQVPINLLQFHGDEPDQFCSSFSRPYIKAIRMRPELDVDSEIQKYPGSVGVLLDAYRRGTPGGTGECFDWSRVPRQSHRAIVLAGGLNPSNVSDAIAETQCWGVDVSGGVESSAGVKSPELVSQFVKRAKVNEYPLNSKREFL